MSDRWLDHDRLVGIFQSSLQRISETLESEGEGPLRYVVKDFKVELSTEVQVDEGGERPLVRLLSIDEMVKKKAATGETSRLAFTLQPAPFLEKEGPEAPGKPPPEAPSVKEAFEQLLERLQHDDPKVRLEALRDAEYAGAGTRRLIPLLEKAAKDPDRQIRRAAAALVEMFRAIFQ